MKILIPSTGTEARLHTHKALPKEVEKIWIAHNKEQAEAIARTTGEANIEVSGATGYLGQLAYIGEAVKEGEWFVKADDNIREFLSENGDTLARDEAWRRVEEAVNEAERIGARLVGFSTTGNPFFRKTKYRKVGFCIGKMYVEKKTRNIEPSGQVMKDDYERSAQHLLHTGKVLICNALHSKAKHWELGGIGTREQRAQREVEDCRKLVEEWFGLYRFKAKAGKHPESEIQMRLNSPDQVQQWRVAMRKAGK